MVPETETVSAFAVYSGQAKLSKRQKKRQKLKQKSSQVIKPVKKMKLEKPKKTKKKRLETKNESTSKAKPSFSDTQEIAKPKNINRKEEILNETPILNVSVKNKKRKFHEMVQEIKKIDLEKKGSFAIGQETLKDILGNMELNTFFSKYWEKAPLFIPATSSQKFTNLISTPMIDEMLRTVNMMFGKDLDVTSYSDGVRETHNIEGRAHAHVIWDYYSNGCSVRLLSPQSNLPNVRAINAALQEYFNCYVGANAYLTPPNSQGFAPHYDDIEAFVLQVEGQKSWQIYEPRNKDEILPRYSSPNFKPDDLKKKPILEITLKPGDVLYFPRGYIHQASTIHNQHSLHLTLSMYQKTSYIDLLEKAIPVALANAAADSVEYRRGLPIGYLRSAGLACKKDTADRKLLIAKIKKLTSKLVDYLDVDGAVDQMGVDFMQDALPPLFNKEEISRTILQCGLRMGINGRLANNLVINSLTRIRLIRSACCRFVKEDIKTEESVVTENRLYYSIDNLSSYHNQEQQYIVIPDEMSPAIIKLIQSYPSFTPVASLLCNNDDEKMTLANDLWDRGLLMHDGTIHTEDDYGNSASEEESSHSMEGDSSDDGEEKNVVLDEASENDEDSWEDDNSDE